MFIFLDFVRKGEGGGRTKPIFLYKDNLGSNFKGRGAKLLFPKSNILFGWVVGVKSKFYAKPKSDVQCSVLQGVPQNMSDLVFWIFNPLKCIVERK